MLFFSSYAREYFEIFGIHVKILSFDEIILCSYPPHDKPDRYWLILIHTIYFQYCFLKLMLPLAKNVYFIIHHISFRVTILQHFSCRQNLVPSRNFWDVWKTNWQSTVTPRAYRWSGEIWDVNVKTSFLVCWQKIIGDMNSHVFSHFTGTVETGKAKS